MKILKRREALLRRVPEYSTGKPCKRGHLSPRNTKYGYCLQCYREDKDHARDAYRKSVSPHQRLRNWKVKNLPEPTREEQDFCEACGKIPEGNKKRLSLDHCHTTGKFRGWLCYKCNSGLGFLGDNLEGVMNIVTYLHKYG